MKNLSKLLLLASLTIINLNKINGQSTYQKSNYPKELEIPSGYIEIPYDTATPLFPKKYYGNRDIIKLMRNITGIYDTTKNVYVGVRAGEKDVILKGIGTSILETYNHPNRKRYPKPKDKRYRGLPIQSATTLSATAGIEDYYKKEKILQAQAIKKE